MPTFFFVRRSNGDQIRLTFPCEGCHLVNKIKVPVETSSRQVMHYNTTHMLHVCIYGGYSIMWASRGV